MPQVEPVPFAPGSLLWDLAGEHRGMLVFLMPTLMQAMHPIIGDALSRMPVVLTDPYGRRERSVDSIHLWIYGGAEAVAEGRRLIELHKPVKGRGPDGRDHSALMPEVWSWVPLSAYPAFLMQCEVFGDPLDAADRVRLYAEVQNLARILGVREQHIPPTVEDFWVYYDEMVSTRLVDHPFVHEVLDQLTRVGPPPELPAVLHPLWRAVIPLVGAASRFTVHGTFPPEVRAILGIDWTPRDERLFRLLGQAVRYAVRLSPEWLRYPATPRLARRLARAEAGGRPTAALRRRLAQRVGVLHGRHTTSLT
ncbi:oxygenase MpaB family protein [Pseudonocardia sp. GCM10023141]|uniref:oxygenase MpaB family protein n=1 Tax=Pseudonocardia sp. GCM10023141 TaxID=3252653 RepID=UPI00360DE78D